MLLRPVLPMPASLQSFNVPAFVCVISVISVGCVVPAVGFQALPCCPTDHFSTIGISDDNFEKLYIRQSDSCLNYRRIEFWTHILVVQLDRNIMLTEVYNSSRGSRKDGKNVQYVICTHLVSRISAFVQVHGRMYNLCSVCMYVSTIYKIQILLLGARESGGWNWGV